MKQRERRLNGVSLASRSPRTIVADDDELKVLNALDRARSVVPNRNLQARRRLVFLGFLFFNLWNGHREQTVHHATIDLVLVDGGVFGKFHLTLEFPKVSLINEPFDIAFLFLFTGAMR